MRKIKKDLTVQIFNMNCNKINAVEKVVHREDIKHTTILSFGQNQVSFRNFSKVGV